jgi:nucleotide-binding universal stress UspA family protein
MPDPSAADASRTDHPLIVVGVDGSPSSDRALAWAVAEARQRGGRVRVVTATGYAKDYGGMAETSTAREARLKAETEQANALGRLHVNGGDDVVEASEVLHGPPVHVLVGEAHHADLLVVGSRGHGRVRDALVGSVAQGCIRNASCPVVVLPALLAEPEEGAGETASAHRAVDYTVGPIY